MCYWRVYVLSAGCLFTLDQYQTNWICRLLFSVSLIQPQSSATHACSQSLSFKTDMHYAAAGAVTKFDFYYHFQQLQKAPDGIWTTPCGADVGLFYCCFLEKQSYVLLLFQKVPQKAKRPKTWKKKTQLWSGTVLLRANTANLNQNQLPGNWKAVILLL